MKRPVLLSLLVVPLLVVVILGGYWFLGTATETGVKRYFGGENPLQGATLELASYERGFFKSRATSSIRFSPDEEPVRLINEIYHGPFAFAPGGIKAGTGHVVTTLDLESLPQEVREKVASFYEGKDPLEITTDVNFGGSRTSTVTLASVDHDEDGAQIRFGGGSGTFSFSPDNSRIDGQLAIEPVSLRFKEENSNFRLRGDRTTVSLKMSSETTSVVADGGSINLSFDGDSQGSFEIEGMQFSSLFSPAGPHSKVMLGSGKFTLPGAKASWEEQSGGGQKGSFEMKDLSFEIKTSEANGLVTTSSDYDVASLTLDSSTATAAGPVIPLLRDGAQMSFSATLPREIVEEVTSFQETLNPGGGIIASTGAAQMSAAQAEELARLIESALRKISAGTGFQIQARIGPDDSGPGASLSFSYQGDRPLTAQKTYIEIIEASKLRLETKVPKALFEGNGEMQGQILGMLAIGALKEDGSNYSSVLALEGTGLTANGKPLPILENFLPLLSQEIAWDAFFTGLQAGARAQAAPDRENEDSAKPE
ncbi:MAG: DUF945 family protein [Verrucomicrobiae bacterium]|nr:DUF945 family protein [Verrucomicrobiae bacterium]